MFICFPLTEKNLDGSKEKLLLRNRESVIVVRETKSNCVPVLFNLFNFQFSNFQGSVTMF